MSLLKQIFYKGYYGGFTALWNKNALFKAVETGNTHLTNHLLTKANVDNQDKNGNTILHYAIKNNRYDMAEMLLKWGAKPNIANNNGMTASDISVANVIFAKISLAQNYTHCMKPLLENRDVEIADTNSFVDTVRWNIDSLRTLHTLTNQQQVHLSPSSNLKELSNNVNFPVFKAIGIVNSFDNVPDHGVTLSGDGMTTEGSDIF